MVTNHPNTTINPTTVPIIILSKVHSFSSLYIFRNRTMFYVLRIKTTLSTRHNPPVTRNVPIKKQRMAFLTTILIHRLHQIIKFHFIKTEPRTYASSSLNNPYKYASVPTLPSDHIHHKEMVLSNHPSYFPPFFLLLGILIS